MFDIGWSELLVIGVVALVVIGPKDLPKVLRGLGSIMSKVRSLAAEFQGQFQDAIREAELAELKKDAEKLAATATDAIQNPMQSIENQIQKSIDEPAQPPKLQPTPPVATDAQVDSVIPAPAQPEPVKIDPVPMAPDVAIPAENADAPGRKQGNAS